MIKNNFKELSDSELIKEYNKQYSLSLGDFFRPILLCFTMYFLFKIMLWIFILLSIFLLISIIYGLTKKYIYANLLSSEIKKRF